MGRGGSAMQGPGKGSALSLVHIAQATTEEVHHAHYEPRHAPGLRLSDAVLHDSAQDRALDLDYLNPAPRFAHRTLLLMRLVVVKKTPQVVL